MRRLLFPLLALFIGQAHAQTIPQFSVGEVFNSAKINAATKGPLDVLSIGVGLPYTGQFYRDAGANVTRLGDRLFVGAASDNPAHANRADTPTDWLTTALGATSIGPWPVWGAQGASLARFGNIAWLGASRTSDARASSALLGYVPASIGLAGFAINDDTNSPTTTTAWGGYLHAIRLAGVNYQPTFGAEVEVENRGGAITGTSNPYHVNNGGGTYGIQIGCGGGETSGTSNCDSGLTFVKNNSAFAGPAITIASNALSGTDGTAGDGGFAPAIDIGRNQAIVWRTPETSGGVQGLNAGLFIRSTVATGTNATRIEATDTGLLFSNASGQQIFAVNTAATAINSLYLQTGTSSGQAAGIYAAPGGANGNIGLFPGSGGELQISSPVCGVGNAVPGTVGAGFLSMNINGSDVRIPLVTPAQAGC